MSMDYERTPGGVPAEGASLSGLTVAQAKEFNKLFITSFLIFTVIALLAHIAAYTWRPWGKTQAPMAPAAATSPLYSAPAAATPSNT